MKKTQAKANSHYELPQALRHDAHTVAEDAQTLIQATIDVADAKVVAARERLESALESGKDMVDRVQSQTMEGARRTNECVRSHPYESMALAFGVGAILGCLVLRR